MNEDAKISQEALEWHFQDIIDDARRRLAYLEFQLKESHDFKGHAHKPWVEAVVANINQYLDEAEQFLQRLDIRAEDTAQRRRQGAKDGWDIRRAKQRTERTEH